LYASSFDICRFGEQRTLVVKHLIAPKHKGTGVFFRDFARFHLSKRICDVAGVCLLGEHGVSDHILVHARGLYCDIKTRIHQKITADLRGRREDERDGHVDNPVDDVKDLLRCITGQVSEV
jgi:hypothetical protein